MPRFTIVCVTAAVLLAGCAGLRPGYETPTVTVKSFRAIPSEGMLPEFEIDLHVVNPNREPLKLVGVSYTVTLEGHELIRGVGNELPVIGGSVRRCRSHPGLDVEPEGHAQLQLRGKAGSRRPAAVYPH